MLLVAGDNGMERDHVCFSPAATLLVVRTMAGDGGKEQGHGDDEEGMVVAGDDWEDEK